MTEYIFYCKTFFFQLQELLKIVTNNFTKTFQNFTIYRNFTSSLFKELHELLRTSQNFTELHELLRTSQNFTELHELLKLHRTSQNFTNSSNFTELHRTSRLFFRKTGSRGAIFKAQLTGLY